MIWDSITLREDPGVAFIISLALSALAYLFILTIYLEAKKNFWSDVGEDPGIDPALAAAIDRTLSLLPRHIP